MARTLRTPATIAGAATAGLLGVAAAAAATSSPLPASVQRLMDCRSTADVPARAACYDAAVDEFGRLLASGEVLVVDKERVAAVRRQAFGFSLPTLSFFERGDKPVQLEEITAVAKRAYRQGDGRWAVELEDGAVWAQTDDEQMDHDPRPGSKVQINKAALSSFFMKIDGQRALRARRIR